MQLLSKLRYNSVRWRIAGLTCFTLAMISVITLPPQIGIVLGLLLLYPAVEFATAVIRKPLPFSQGYLVINTLRKLETWLEHQTKSARISEHQGNVVLERRMGFDFRVMYLPSGEFYGTEQTIDWADTDSNWKPGDPPQLEVLFKPASESADPQKRLPLIARLRSPKP